MPAVVMSGSPPRTGSYVDQPPKKAEQSMQETTSRRARGSAAQLPQKGSAEYAAMLGRAAAFALEINTNLPSDKTIWSFGQIAAARKGLADLCINSQFAKAFKRPDGAFYSETQIWDILNEGVQSWQEASVNRNRSGDANEKLTGDDIILEQLAAAKQLVAAKAGALADVRRQKTEYGASMTACQEKHLQGAQRKDRCPTNLKQLVRIFSERESEVAHTFEETHGREPTTDQLLELVFEHREERDLAMIKEWFANKQVSDRRAMRKCAASYGGIVALVRNGLSVHVESMGITLNIAPQIIPRDEIQQQEIHNPAHLGRRHTIEGRLQVHIGTRARHVAQEHHHCRFSTAEKIFLVLCSLAVFLI
jgi:hypothetical protein